MKSGVLHKYGKYLPLTDTTPMITLGEGDTPLLRSQNIGKMVGCADLYFKVEGCNPTGSFKDRGMVVAVAKALEAGATGIICASTGNTSASAAAYGSHVHLPTTVVVPSGHVSRGKMVQAIAYGASIVTLGGNFDDSLRLARFMATRDNSTLVNSTNPYRLQGQKTAGFEIVEEFGDAPDHVFIPVGNAGNITSYWIGFTEAYDIKLAATLPKMMGIQASGASPIVDGSPVEIPETIATAIRIGRPVNWDGALRARDESNGAISAVSDHEIIQAYELMAREEGIFCEPSSAAGVAGLFKSLKEGLNLDGKRVVCIITGNGLKDQERANCIEPSSIVEYQG